MTKILGDEEREPREWLLITKMASCPPIHSDLAAVAPWSEARIRGGEKVRVVEAIPIERKPKHLRDALTACEKERDNYIEICEERLARARYAERNNI